MLKMLVLYNSSVRDLRQFISESVIITSANVDIYDEF